MKKLVIAASIMVISLNGCAVIMAASGKPSPSESSIKVGSSKHEIDYILGKPKTTRMLDSDRTLAIYKYRVGDEASAGRASFHAVMDLLTVFVWELVGTPIEIFHGENEKVEIQYGPDQRVVSLRRL